MLLCEAALMTIIVILGIYVTYTDIKQGIIQNKALAIAAIGGAIINSIYFPLFGSEFLVIYLCNFLVMIVFAIALYSFHFWAAGDSKLLICVNLLFPARLYDNDVFSFAPGLNAIIFVFLIAYGYIIIDSVVLFIKREKFYAEKNNGWDGIINFAKGYLISFLYLRGLSEILKFITGDIYYENQLLFSFMNIFVAIVIHSKKVFRRWYLLIGILGVNLFFVRSITFDTFELYAYGILLVALVLRYLLNGYNYKEIATDTVKRGMVLSYATVTMFIPSRIKGLPKTTSEDMRSRLKEEEVDAIKRWRNSKYGRETITIVRKIPFAIFIVAGEILYFFIRIVK
ncbi:MAG: hypothetical protein IJA36_03230 [Lachnospiraceae bacterium]|nr:hypothetical protein [Lachnospiraceae bacterium]